MIFSCGNIGILFAFVWLYAVNFAIMKTSVCFKWCLWRQMTPMIALIMLTSFDGTIQFNSEKRMLHLVTGDTTENIRILKTIIPKLCDVNSTRCYGELAKYMFLKELCSRCIIIATSSTNLQIHQNSCRLLAKCDEMHSTVFLSFPCFC